MQFLEASYKKNKNENKTTNNDNKTTTYICNDFTHIYVILKLFAVVVCIVQPTCKYHKEGNRLLHTQFLPSFCLLLKGIIFF